MRWLLAVVLVLVSSSAAVAAGRSSYHPAASKAACRNLTAEQKNILVETSNPRARVEILSPFFVEKYGAAQISYFRTVLAQPLPASRHSLNSSTTGPSDVVCPAVLGDCDTYLITGSSIVATNQEVRRRCRIPAGKRIILAVLNAFEWSSNGIYDYNEVVPALINASEPVQLSPFSLQSFVQAEARLPSACVIATINGVEVTDLRRFFTGSPFVPNMFVGPGAVEEIARANGLFPPAKDAQHQAAIDMGFPSQDFAGSGFYLIFPEGLKKGMYTFFFGTRPGPECNVFNDWFANGTFVSRPKECWPNKDCRGATQTLNQNLSALNAVWRYTVTVE